VDKTGHITAIIIILAFIAILAAVIVQSMN